MASIEFKDGDFSIKSPPSLRGDPDIEFQHRLKTGAHLRFIQDEKLFDVSDGRWATKIIDGEKCYAHEYDQSLLVLRLRTADGKLNLTHNEAFDSHLRDNPGATTVYSITSSNNGVQSTQTFAVQSAGLGTIPMLCAIIVLSVNLASAQVAAAAAVAAGTTVSTLFGIPTTVANPAIGIVIVILGLIGIWIAYAVEREISLNLIYENRSSKKTVNLVDHYVYNIGDNPLKPPVAMPALKSVPPWEVYSNVVVNVDNYTKLRGIGVSLKFKKDDGSSLIICIRNDIYKDPHYSIKQYAEGDVTTAKDAYDKCDGNLVTDDYAWGSADLIVKNGLNPDGFKNYNFSGIISFHDVA